VYELQIASGQFVWRSNI